MWLQPGFQAPRDGDAAETAAEYYDAGRTRRTIHVKSLL